MSGSENGAPLSKSSFSEIAFSTRKSFSLAEERSNWKY